MKRPSHENASVAFEKHHERSYLIVQASATHVLTEFMSATTIRV
jgi:hypothetical protein